jgi:hypothetical protein
LLGSKHKKTHSSQPAFVEHVDTFMRRKSTSHWL